jgi:hypothetical protein
MTPDAISLNDAQFEKIITALSGNRWSHWFQVASIFVSAFLGYMSGIALEHFKNRRAAAKALDEQQRHQVAQIKVAIAGIAFNIESMLHAVFQNVLPHHEQSHLAFKELQTTKGDGDRISQFAIGLHKYPALMMTCPEMHFVQWDFFKELPFLVEKDPELLKQAGWLLRRAREINKAISDRNNYIQAAIELTATQRGGLNFYQLDGILQRQVSVSNAECVTALEFFSMLLDTAKRLEAISGTYKIPGAQTKLIPPEPLAEAMRKLAAIHKEAVQQMPGYEWPGTIAAAGSRRMPTAPRSST